MAHISNGLCTFYLIIVLVKIIESDGVGRSAISIITGIADEYLSPAVATIVKSKNQEPGSKSPNPRTEANDK